jgi:hypothetical protein
MITMQVEMRLHSANALRKSGPSAGRRATSLDVNQRRQSLSDYGFETAATLRGTHWMEGLEAHAALKRIAMEHNAPHATVSDLQRCFALRAGDGGASTERMAVSTTSVIVVIQCH